MRWKVGSYCFDEQSNELTNNQYSLLLEPKPAAMLHYLIQNTGKDISRDEIMAAVWPNQIVSENAINRTIVQLRKALNDTEKVKRFIVTVPKVGYRFIATCSPLEENLSTPAEITEVNAPIAVNKKSKHIYLVVTLVIVACLVFALQYIQTYRSPSLGSADYKSVKISPLTRFSDAEFDAELAHDNQQLVYTTHAENGYNIIMYRATPTSQPIRISQLEGNASTPRWSLDDSQLVYLYKNQSRCEFHIVTIKNAQPSLPTIVYHCPQESDSQFVFTQNKENIVFTEKKSQFSPYVVYELDIKNSNKKRLIQPVARGKGNHYLDYDAQKDELLLLSESDVGKSNVFSLDITNQTFRKLIELDYRVDSVIWGHADNTIVHPGIHPSYQLIQTNINDGTSQTLVSDSRRISSPKRINNNTDFLFTSYLYNRDITLTANIPTNINSAVMDYIPALSQDENQIAFISKRSGYSQIWLYSRDTQTLNVFDGINDGRTFYSLDWSFNDRKLLLNSSRGLMIWDVEFRTLEHEILPSLPSYASSWYSNNEVTYSVFQNEQWLVHKYNLDSKTSQVLDKKWAFSVSNNSSSLFIDQDMEMLLFGKTHNYNDLCAPLINRFSFNIRFTNNGFYCPAKDNYNDLLHIDKENNLHRLKGVVNQVPFYSISNTLIANIELKNSVSDIMRTNFLPSPEGRPN